jgi:hypothetical protein
VSRFGEGDGRNAVPVFIETHDARSLTSGYFLVHLPSMAGVQLEPSDDISNLNV